jgi:WD40 repeat protein
MYIYTCIYIDIYIYMFNIYTYRWVWDVVFSADSLYLVTASSDQTAKLWDLRSGEVIRNYSGICMSIYMIDMCIGISIGICFGVCIDT